MLFHKLETGATFRWRDAEWRKVKNTLAEPLSGGDPVFIPSHEPVEKIEVKNALPNPEAKQKANGVPPD